MKVNWKIVSVVAPIVLAAGTWLASVEYRLGTYQSTMNLGERVENLETLLTPVIIDHRVEQRLRELREQVGRVEPPPVLPTMAPPEAELREEAQEWATKQFKR